METRYAELNLPVRTLLGPGPSNVHPRVLRAMATPVIGHLDPKFLELMDQTAELLRFAFQTDNSITFALPGTGSAGMEAALVNLIEPGDGVVVGVNGYFGERLCEMALRHGAKVCRVEAPWGQIVDPDQIERALAGRRAKLVAIVHAETSTGVLQPIRPIADACRRHGALLVVDAVTSLGGSPVAADEWEADVCFSCSQKGLSCPPGLAPITVSDRAVAVAGARRSPFQSWYLDLSLITRYWGSDRLYHHTAPISMLYALREALCLVREEGLEPRWHRHKIFSDALAAGLIALGLQILAPEAYRAPTLTVVRIPEGIPDIEVRKALLS
ncbi:MAG: alanine--glyoxylate aminotransferase family protein, partial [candidate division NC10 bacterium]|nr:alanine--glyoxylate aminotransferase family protein [candidate division NC10 bacterium]